MGRPASEWNGRITSSLAKHRNYRLFFLGQLVSLTGTWMQDVALPWLVYHETKSPFAVGLLVFFRFVPFLVLGLFAGVLADRVDNRRLLIATQTISSLLAFILAALAFTNSPPIWAIYAVAILGGAAVVIEGPSRQALVYQLVGRDELPNAIALNASLFNAARAVGPALGGVLIAVVGVGWCFMFNALSFMAVLTMLLLMRASELFPVARDRDPQPTLQGDQGRPLPRVGLAADAHDRHLHRHDEPRGIQLPRPRAVARRGRLQRERRSSSARSTRASASARPSGRSSSPVAAAPAGRRSRSAPPGSASRRSGSRSSAASPPPIVLLFTAGISFTTWVANGQSLLQLAAPDQLRGRVVSIYIFVFAGFMPVSAVAEGWLADRLGTRFAFAFAGVAGLLAAGYAFRRLRAIYSGRSGPLAGAEDRPGAGMSAAEDDGASIPPGADAPPSPWRLSSGLLKIIAIGLVAGLFSSLFGVGGGIVAVPLLMMLAGFPAHEATGTSLAAIVITATVGATLYAIEGEVDFARAALVGIPAVGGVLLGHGAAAADPGPQPHLCLRSTARRARDLDAAR